MARTKALHKPSKSLFFPSIIGAPSQMFAWVCHEKKVGWGQQTGGATISIVFLVGLHKQIRLWMVVSFLVNLFIARSHGMSVGNLSIRLACVLLETYIDTQQW